MNRRILAILLAMALVFCAFSFTACGEQSSDDNKEEAKIKIGVISVGDENEGYTYAHMDGIRKAAEKLGIDEKTQIIWKNNIPESELCKDAALDLADAGCNLVISNSYGHQDFMQEAAEECPDVQFVSMTGDKAANSGRDNLANAFTSVYQSRYVSGVVAGMKLAELIKDNKLTDKNYDADGNVLLGSTQQTKLVHEFDGAGLLQGMHNTDASIRAFAHSCFRYAVETEQSLWFSTKDTISKTYDQTFKMIFQEIYESDYKADFEAKGIEYFYTLIDDAVARVIRSEGGFIWALKNYDGDVMSDMVSTAFGSLAMMTSVLVSPSGVFEYEAAHGTVTRHYYRHLKGEETSTNPMATIFAWTGALKKRGELDGNAELCAFAESVEKACIAAIEEGYVTGDLAALIGPEAKKLTTMGFLKNVRARLEA